MYSKNKLHQLWTANPTIYSLLRDSENYKVARNHLHNYLSELLRTIYYSSEKMQPLEFAVPISSGFLVP